MQLLSTLFILGAVIVYANRELIFGAVVNFARTWWNNEQIQFGNAVAITYRWMLGKAMAFFR